MKESSFYNDNQTMKNVFYFRINNKKMCDSINEIQEKCVKLIMDHKEGW